MRIFARAVAAACFLMGFSWPSLAMAPLATRKKILLLNAGAQADALANALAAQGIAQQAAKTATTG